MIGTILVPLDGSNLARHALPYAAHLAQATHARLVVFHAYRANNHDAGADPELDLVIEQADLASGLRDRGVNATTWLSYDEPGPAIVKTASDLQADMIVMSTHGRGGVSQLMYGSVAEHVVRKSGVPVVLVTAMSRPHWSDDLNLRLLVTLDGSAFAEAAIGPAGVIARALHADLVLLRVVEQSGNRAPVPPIHDARRYLDDVAAPLRAAGHHVEERIETGPPADAIARVADELSPSIVVMATHGRGLLSRLLVEKVASQTLRKVSAPMLLVRPHLADEASRSDEAVIEPMDRQMSTATTA